MPTLRELTSHNLTTTDDKMVLGADQAQYLAPKNNPVFTGNVNMSGSTTATAPTPPINPPSNSIATTGYIDNKNFVSNGNPSANLYKGLERGSGDYYIEVTNENGPDDDTITFGTPNLNTVLDGIEVTTKPIQYKTDSSNKVATTSFVQSQKNNPTFTGNVVVPNGDAWNEAVNKGQLDYISKKVQVGGTRGHNINDGDLLFVDNIGGDFQAMYAGNPTAGVTFTLFNISLTTTTIKTFAENYWVNSQFEYIDVAPNSSVTYTWVVNNGYAVITSTYGTVTIY